MTLLPREDEDGGSRKTRGSGRWVGNWLTAAALLTPALVPRSLRGQDIPPDPPSALGNPQTDAAVHRALEYLKTVQKPDGGWESGGFGEATSVTSLAVMAFLAA